MNNLPKIYNRSRMFLSQDNMNIDSVYDSQQSKSSELEPEEIKSDQNKSLEDAKDSMDTFNHIEGNHDDEESKERQRLEKVIAKLSKPLLLAKVFVNYPWVVVFSTYLLFAVVCIGAYYG